MPVKSTVSVQGLSELGERLKRLGSDVALKHCRAATSAGATVVKKQAIINAPESDEEHMLEGVKVQPGNLKKNIVVKRVTKSEHTSEHIVTVRGKKKDGYAARYGRLDEFGTVKMAAKPYLRPAFDTKKGEALEKIRQTLEKRIIKSEVGK